MSEELNPLNQENTPETPPVETAEDLGEVAVGEGSTPSQVESVRLAHEMAEAEAPLRDMINNIRESDLPNKNALVETLEKDIDKITDQAKERYLEAEQRYKTVRDLAIGNVMLMLRGDVASGEYGPIVGIGNLNSSGGRVELGEGKVDMYLSAEQVGRLREEIYTLFGAKSPDIFEDGGSDSTGMRYSSAEVAGNVTIPGRKIIERRNIEKGQSYPRVTIGFESA